MPEHPNPAARYLIYLHGSIIQTQGRRPTHPDYGVYEYDEILDALAARGFQVISEARPAGTKVPAYAEKVAARCAPWSRRACRPTTSPSPATPKAP